MVVWLVWLLFWFGLFIILAYDLEAFCCSLLLSLLLIALSYCASESECWSCGGCSTNQQSILHMFASVWHYFLITALIMIIVGVILISSLSYLSWPSASMNFTNPISSTAIDPVSFFHAKRLPKAVVPSMSDGPVVISYTILYNIIPSSWAFQREEINELLVHWPVLPRKRAQKPANVPNVPNVPNVQFLSLRESMCSDTWKTWILCMILWWSTKKLVMSMLKR